LADADAATMFAARTEKLYGGKDPTLHGEPTMTESDKKFYNAPLLEILEKTDTLEEFRKFVDFSDVGEFLRDAWGFVETSLTGSLEAPIAFMRIPKCATTSVHRCIARMYRSVWTFDGNGLHSVHHGACDGAADAMEISTWEMRRTALAYLLAHTDAKFVAGHFEVNEDLLEKFRDTYSFITLLRDPVERWMSHYLYNKHLPRDRYDISADMGDFVDTPRGRGIGQMYTAYLSGTGNLSPDERDTEEVRAQARENLASFDLVGIVEEMGAFEDQFLEQFGVELDVPHRNDSPAPEGAKDISDELRNKIRDVCSADLELYNYAREHFAA